jgi:hypothetical protein
MAKEPAGLKRWRLSQKKKSLKGRVTMASSKFKKVAHRAKKMTIPVAMIAGFAPLVSGTVGYIQKDGLAGGTWFATQALTGYDTQVGKFWAPNLKKGLLPIVLGMAIHKFVGGTLGVNRMLAGAGVPLLRL